VIRPAYRYVTVDSIQVSSALVTARCPHVHPSTHRLFPTIPGQHSCGGCRRRFSDAQVVELAQRMSACELGFTIVAELVARDPQDLKHRDIGEMVDRAFDLVRWTADLFEVRL
jgi:hypothetical protein